MQNDVARQLIDQETGRLKSFDRWRRDIQGMTSHYVDSWLKTEYDTAVNRAHQAADWKHFQEEADVFPNVRWMPTTSITPDPLHQHYWQLKLTLPVNHPFWDEHHPGDRWNCKCTLQQTDEPVNAEALDGWTPPLPMPGLDNNPAKDGKIFSDTHPYVTEAYPGAKDAVKKALVEKTYTFVAKTVEEAQNFVTDYIAESCDFPFKKTQLESASKVLSLLKERMDFYGLKKFSTLKTPDKKGALAAYEDFDHSLRISPRLFGDLTRIYENEQKFIKKYGYPYSTNHVSVEDIVRNTIDHELGHALKFSHPAWQGKIIAANAKDRTNVNILGYYSSTNLDEFFAEVIAGYWGPLYKDMSKLEIELVEDLFKSAGFKVASSVHRTRRVKTEEDKRRIQTAWDKRRIERRKEQFQQLKKDSNYENVEFDEKNGALRASHIKHNHDARGGPYETSAQNAGFKHGHSVIFESEEHKQTGQRFTEGLWDGLRFEVAGAETSTDNNLLRAIEHCADKRTTEIAVIVFPKGGFSEEKIRKALGRYRGLKKLNDGEYIDFKRIICIQDEDIVYDKPF